MATVSAAKKVFGTPNGISDLPKRDHGDLRVVTVVCTLCHRAPRVDQRGDALAAPPGITGRQLLRRVASRRRDRCELSLIAAVIALLQQDWRLLEALSAHTKLKLEVTLSNVS